MSEKTLENLIMDSMLYQEHPAGSSVSFHELVFNFTCQFFQVYIVNLFVIDTSKRFTLKFSSSVDYVTLTLKSNKHMSHVSFCCISYAQDYIYIILQLRS